MGASCQLPSGDDRPEEAPPAYTDTRAELAAEFLWGSGIEIGALNCPLAVPPHTSVTYVDRMPVEDLRARYPELADVPISRVDVIDDGERLESFTQESVDFIIANHFLEHCEDPIRTIETHFGKLRPGGVLFYAVPDKRYTFDFRRPRTSLRHVIGDYEDGGQSSRSEHYLEWARLNYPEGGEPLDEPAARQHAAGLEATSYSIHFHVWTQADLLQLVLYCQQRFGTFEVEAIRRRAIENIIVLRKQGEQPATSHLGRRLANVSELQQRIGDLERELDEARRDADATRQQASVLGERLTHSGQALSDVINSKSWRLTGPLRTAKHLFKRG